MHPPEFLFASRRLARHRFTRPTRTTLGITSLRIAESACEGYRAEGGGRTKLRKSRLSASSLTLLPAARPELFDSLRQVEAGRAQIAWNYNRRRYPRAPQGRRVVGGLSPSWLPITRALWQSAKARPGRQRFEKADNRRPGVPRRTSHLTLRAAPDGGRPKRQPTHPPRTARQGTTKRRNGQALINFPATTGHSPQKQLGRPLSPGCISLWRSLRRSIRVRFSGRSAPFDCPGRREKAT